VKYTGKGEKVGNASSARLDVIGSEAEKKLTKKELTRACAAAALFTWGKEKGTKDELYKRVPIRGVTTAWKLSITHKEAWKPGKGGIAFPFLKGGNVV